MTSVLLWFVTLTLGSVAWAADHAVEEAVIERPTYGRSCELFPTGSQRHFPSFGPGAFSPEGNSAFTVSQSDVPQIVGPTGGTKSLNLDGRILDSGFSGDGRHLFTAVAGQGVKLWEAASGKGAGSVSHSAIVTVTQFSPDGKYLFSADTDGVFKLTDVTLGRTVLEGKHDKPVTKAAFSADSKVLGVASRDGTAVAWDIASGEKKFSVDHGAPVDAIAFSSDGSHLITGGRDERARITELSSGKQTIVRHEEWVKDAAISPDGRYAVSSSSDGLAKVTDLNTGEPVRIVKHDKEISHTRFTPDGKHLVTASVDGKVKITDVANGGEVGSLSHTNRVNAVAISSDGRLIASASRDGFAKVWDIASGREIASPKHGGIVDTVEFSKDGKKLLTGSNRKLVAADLEPICVESVPKFVSSRRPEDGKAQHDEILRDLCPKEFKAEDWAEWTPAAPSKTLPFALAKTLLLRFQKPGGFEPKAHLPYLVSILNSDMPQREPDLVAGALQNVAGTSTQLYDSLIERFKVRLKGNGKGVCRTEAETKKVEEFGKKYLNSLLNKNEHSPTKYSDWAGLAPFSGQLAKMSEAAKDRYLHDISDSMQYGASLNRQLGDVFQSKLFYYSEEAAGEFFGRPSNPLRTEVATVREKDKIRVMLLGTQPIDGDPATMTEHGFAVKPLGDIPLRNNLPTGELDMKALGFNPDISWSHAGKKYTAHLNGKVMASIAETVPREGRYPHERLWEDKTMRGLVFTGANARKESAGTIDGYIGYYQERGYEFGKKEEIPDLKKFIEEKVASGDLDYLIKEAHSGGDEKNLVEIEESADVRVGRKTHPDGRVEEVFVVFPKPKEVKTTWIDNDEFGKWVRNRETGDKPPLVYFNASCWSHQKALFEIEATYSKKLIDLPFTTLEYFFRNRKGSPKVMIYDDFFEGKDFAHTRERLKSDERYRSGTGDVFIFPDEEVYQEKIIDKLKIPVVVDLQMFGEEGKPHYPGREAQPE